MSRPLAFPVAGERSRLKPSRFATSGIRRRLLLSIDWLEGRVLLTGGDPFALNPTAAALAANALPLSLGATATGTLTSGSTDFYAIAPSANGLLMAQVHASGLNLRLTLLDSAAHKLSQSDGQSASLVDPLIQQHVVAGTEYLAVQSLGGSGTFTLSASLTPSSDPTANVSATYPFGFTPVAQGDFTHDGIPDLVTVDGVHPGVGDGTFAAVIANSAIADPGTGPATIVTGHFFGTKNLDVAVSLSSTDTVLFLQGNGDGTFQAPISIALPTGSFPTSMVAGDFGNGHLDLAVTDTNTSSVSILLGDGQGNFTVQAVAVGNTPSAITAGVFENNGRLDLAVTDAASGDVVVLSNQGGGNFTPLRPIMLPSFTTPLGSQQLSAPQGIAAGNFGGGNVGLAISDSVNSVLYVLLGNGAGSFTLGSTIKVGVNPSTVVTGDFGNGQTDIAVADGNSSNLAIIMINGDGTFQPTKYMPTGFAPGGLVVADFNRDGRVDLASANANTSDISILLGKGDGTFQVQVNNLVGSTPTALATGDFTGNGHVGLAVVNQNSNDVTIIPGNGDGTFQRSLTVTLPAGAAPTAIVAGDFNGDGRTDLAITDSGLNAVSILLGNGDGTFQPLQLISVGNFPNAITSGDFGNGHIDLAVSNLSDSTVSILMGSGTGSFTPGATIPVGLNPTSIIAGDFGRGYVDLAVGDTNSDDLRLLRGDGTGAFPTQTIISLGSSTPQTITLVAADFGNGHLDLAAAVYDPNTVDSVMILINRGDGTFLAPVAITLGSFVGPTGIVSGSFNGHMALITADSNGSGTQDYSVFIGNGDGTFAAPVSYALGGAGSATSLVIGGFSGVGHQDLAFTRNGPDDVLVRLNQVDGTFADPSLVDLVLQDTPVVADLTGTGVTSVAVIDAAGKILYRAGRAGQPGSFAPPIVMNYGNPSRGITFVHTALGPMIASVNANSDEISFYGMRGKSFVLLGTLATGHLPAQILTADVTGDGRDDLIVRNAGDGTISVFAENSVGWFQTRVDTPIGSGISDVGLGSLHPNGLPDLLITNRLSGEVGVLTNLGGGEFSAPVFYQAGSGPYGMALQSGQSPTLSTQATASVATGRFVAGGLTSVVTLNPGTNTLVILSGLGDGRLANAQSLPTSSSGLVVRAADLTGNGLSDLVILGPGNVTVMMADGRGGFLSTTTYNVGFEPNGLTIADVNQDGKPDIVVGNPLGDVLVLINQGHGTFASVRPVDQQVSLALTDSSGKTEFIFSDQLHDQLVIRNGGTTTVLGDASTGLVSPGAIKLSDLNGSGNDALIVANSGSNNVLVYPGLGNGKFGTGLNGGHGFFTGTNPVGISVADVNGDGRPDLIIANKGSNDVSILINTRTPDGGYTFVPGPRLRVGDGPVNTVVQSVTGSSQPDLIVTDSGSNDVRILKGIGNGFFNDVNQTVIPVGTNPGTLFVGQFTNAPGLNIVSVNSGSNDITLVSNLTSLRPVTQSIGTGGLSPEAAFVFEVAETGASSLVIANNGNGVFSVLSPGDEGMSLTSTEAVEGISNPSAVAFSTFSGGSIDFFAATEGEQSATLVSLNVDTASTSEEGSSSSGPNTTATLAPLNSNSLALLATLLTTTLSTQNESESATGALAEVLGGAVSSAVTQPLNANLLGDGPNSLEEEEAEAPGTAEAPNQTDTEVPGLMPWVKFVTGISNSFEELRDEADNLFNDAKATPVNPSDGGQGMMPIDQALRTLVNVAVQSHAITQGHPEVLLQNPTIRRNLIKTLDAVIDSLAAETDLKGQESVNLAAQLSGDDQEHESPGMDGAVPVVAVACVALLSSSEILRRTRKRVSLRFTQAGK